MRTRRSMYKSPPSASQKEAIESDSIDPDIKNQTETDIMNEDMTTKNEVTKEIIQESDSENPNPNEKQEMIKIDPKEEKVFGDMNEDFEDEKMDILAKIEAIESNEANISNENDEKNESDK